MSTTYPDLTETLFPDAIDPLSRMSDVQIADLALILEYYKRYNAGDINGARDLLEQNPQLNNKIMNAAKFNQLSDAITAIQRFFATYGFSGSGNKTRGIWKETINYNMGDNVSYDNIIWQAVEDNINSKPTDENPDWIKVLVFSVPPLTWGDIKNGKS